MITGLTWAPVWAGAGLLLWPVLLTKAHASASVLNAVVLAVVAGWYGFLAGTIFSGVVVFLGRRHALRDLTLRRAGLWGTLTSIVFTVPPMIYMRVQPRHGPLLEDVIYLAASMVLCTGCSVATLLLARHGAALHAASNPLALSSELTADVFRVRKEVVRESTEG